MTSSGCSTTRPLTDTYPVTQPYDYMQAQVANRWPSLYEGVVHIDEQAIKELAKIVPGTLNDADANGMAIEIMLRTLTRCGQKEVVDAARECFARFSCSTQAHD